MFCTKCGAQLPENSEFCNVCGTKQAPLMPLQPEMPVQPMVQGVQQMYNNAMQNPMNNAPNQSMQGYQSGVYQNQTPQGYQPNMSGNSNPNSKKTKQMMIWIVLTVLFIAIAVFLGVLLKKQNDKKDAERDEVVEQWNQTVQDAQNAQTSSGNNSYVDNNDYGNTFGCVSWEEAVFDYVQCYWNEDMEGALATLLAPQRELMRDGILAEYGSEEAFWEAVYTPWFNVCGDNLSMDFEIVDATRLEGAEQLASVENAIYNECGYSCTLTDAYLLQIDIEYSGDIGTASDAWYFYAVQMDDRWYLYEI